MRSAMNADTCYPNVPVSRLPIQYTSKVSQIQSIHPPTPIGLSRDWELDMFVHYRRYALMLAETAEDFIDSLVAGWIDGRVPRSTRFEKRFDNTREVAFGVTFFDEAVVDGIAERSGVVAGVNEIDGMLGRRGYRAGTGDAVAVAKIGENVTSVSSEFVGFAENLKTKQTTKPEVVCAF